MNGGQMGRDQFNSAVRFFRVALDPSVARLGLDPRWTQPAVSCPSISIPVRADAVRAPQIAIKPTFGPTLGP